MEPNRSDPRLDHLVHLWEELRQLGHTLTPEVLARDVPELADELGRRIAALCASEELPSTQVKRTDEETGLQSPDPDDFHRVSPRAGGFTTVGRLVDARFHAQGGLGEVLVARQQELDRRVALKRIRPDRLHEAAPALPP